MRLILYADILFFFVRLWRLPPEEDLLNFVNERDLPVFRRRLLPPPDAPLPQLGTVLGPPTSALLYLVTSYKKFTWGVGILPLELYAVAREVIVLIYPIGYC
jgi:hypothetical protein